MKKVVVYGMTANYKGGIEEVIMNLLRYSKELEMILVVPGTYTKYENEITELNGLIKYITPKEKSYYQNIKDWCMIVKEYKNDATFYFNAGALYYVIPYLVTRIYGVKNIVVHAHNGKNEDRKFYENFMHYFNRILINKISNKKISCSDIATKWIFGKRYINNKRVLKVYNGVDVEKFSFSKTQRIYYRSKFGVSDSQILLGTVARMEPQKNLSFLIELLSKLNGSKQYDREYKLVIIGEGSLKNELIKQAKRLSVIDDIIFFGQSNNVNDIINSFDIFLLPSLYEGFPIVLVEAQVNGVPIICSDKITKEVNVSGKVKYISISTIDDWLKFILDKKYSRYQMGKKELNKLDIKNKVRIIEKELM